jgi:hypothetical protein
MLDNPARVRATATLIVCTILSGCSSSGGTQGPYGPHLDSIAEVNRALSSAELTLLAGVPVLVGPQR